MPSNKLTLRPVTAQDYDFLLLVFASSRPDILFSHLPVAQKEEFLAMQFRAQDTHYRGVFPNAQYSIVQLRDKRVGRLYVDRRHDEIRVLDITILPEFRNQGLGSQLMLQVQADARARRLPVRIHVDEDSRQVRFYERLGFVRTGAKPTYKLMEWRATNKLEVAY